LIRHFAFHFPFSLFSTPLILLYTIDTSGFYIFLEHILHVVLQLYSKMVKCKRSSTLQSQLGSQTIYIPLTAQFIVFDNIVSQTPRTRTALNEHAKQSFKQVRTPRHNARSGKHVLILHHTSKPNYTTRTSKLTFETLPKFQICQVTGQLY
jgi:hypothetical protein